MDQEQINILMRRIAILKRTQISIFDDVLKEYVPVYDLISEIMTQYNEVVKREEAAIKAAAKAVKERDKFQETLKLLKSRIKDTIDLEPESVPYVPAKELRSNSYTYESKEGGPPPMFKEEENEEAMPELHAQMERLGQIGNEIGLQVKSMQYTPETGNFEIVFYDEVTARDRKMSLSLHKFKDEPLKTYLVNTFRGKEGK